MGYVPSEAYRFERKFIAGNSHPRHVETAVRLHPAGFNRAYPPRLVNNVYLDTWGRESYAENESGVSDLRVKVRIRWYGNLWGRVERPVLELKIKRNIVNRKESFVLPPFETNDKLSKATLTDLIGRAELPPALRSDLLKLDPTLVNRYQRGYFLSANRAFRVTIDSDLSFHAISESHRVATRQRCAVESIILELKYPQTAAENAHAITQHLPYRVARSSKYATGLEALRYRYGSPTGIPRLISAS